MNDGELRRCPRLCIIVGNAVKQELPTDLRIGGQRNANAAEANPFDLPNNVCRSRAKCAKHDT